MRHVLTKPFSHEELPNIFRSTVDAVHSQHTLDPTKKVHIRFLDKDGDSWGGPHVMEVAYEHAVSNRYDMLNRALDLRTAIWVKENNVLDLQRYDAMCAKLGAPVSIEFTFYVKPTYIKEALPSNAVCLALDDGTRVAYIDRNYEIRQAVVATGKFCPGFTSPVSTPEMLEFLKTRLAEEAPWATTLRHLLTPDGGFFLCATEE